MPVSVSLRSLLGLADRPAALKDSVLIMIDCQDTYRRGVMRLEGVEEALTEAARVLSRAREAGIPVIHVRHDAGAGSPYDLEADVGQISAEVAPAPDEPVITKDHPSSFFGTDLETRLRRTGRQDLVLVGFMTHMCVNSTARDAFNLGYRPTIVAAATATRELAGADGKPVTATELQQASLAGMADLFAVVVGKAEEIPD
ncbi:cysteine hydrolase family protein [Streptomyces sp. NPDC001260]|uniref:cysteine hydrolase family protein n=1 Tax=Streptomyces sp. NPDC001260 TaxID=3364551 RepID=UPI0036CF9DB3